MYVQGTETLLSLQRGWVLLAQSEQILFVWGAWEVWLQLHG